MISFSRWTATFIPSLLNLSSISCNIMSNPWRKDADNLTNPGQTIGWAEYIACPLNVTIGWATAHPAHPVPAPLVLSSLEIVFIRHSDLVAWTQALDICFQHSSTYASCVAAGFWLLYTLKLLWCFYINAYGFLDILAADLTSRQADGHQVVPNRPYS